MQKEPRDSAKYVCAVSNVIQCTLTSVLLRLNPRAPNKETNTIESFGTPDAPLGRFFSMYVCNLYVCNFVFQLDAQFLY